MTKPEYAWACISPNLPSRSGFIHNGTVRDTRVDAQEQIGRVWARHGETCQQGWKRAYRAGWRCKRVVIQVNGEAMTGPDKPLSDFDQGYLCAVSNLIHLNGALIEAADVAREAGITWKRIEAYDFCDFDLNNLKKIKGGLGCPFGTEGE